MDWFGFGRPRAVCLDELLCNWKTGAERTRMTMKPLVFKNVPILAGSLMALVLAGCQQTPTPPVVVTPPATTNTERSTTTNTETKQVETPAPTPAPGTVQTQTKTESTTTVEKKKQ